MQHTTRITLGGLSLGISIALLSSASVCEASQNAAAQHSARLTRGGLLQKPLTCQRAAEAGIDEYQAFYGCKQAAESGLPEAQYQLGMMYLNGSGVTADDELALLWLSKAANAGDSQALAVIEYVLNNDIGYGC
jgi:TPR repeat protein